jgi:steroid delta-isomerase-like uncharacterized protein
MNERNTELIRRHFRLEEEGDTDAVLAEMVDQPRYIIPGMFADDTDGKTDIRLVHTGKDAIRKIHEALFDAFTDLHIDVKTLITDDTHGCAEVDVHGVLAGPFDGVEGPGRYVHIQHVAVFTFADGKIASESVYYDRREVLLQAGARETLAAAGDAAG